MFIIGGYNRSKIDNIHRLVKYFLPKGYDFFAP
jgi:hypothetical protein